MNVEVEALQEIVAIAGGGDSKNRSRRAGYLPRSSANKYLREMEYVARNALALDGLDDPQPKTSGRVPSDVVGTKMIERYVVEISTLNGKRRAKRRPLHVPMAAAVGDYQRLSDRALHDLITDLNHERLRRFTA